MRRSLEGQFQLDPPPDAGQSQPALELLGGGMEVDLDEARVQLGVDASQAGLGDLLPVDDPLKTPGLLELAPCSLA